MNHRSCKFNASAWLKVTLTRNKTFRTHLPGTACFNVVHSDDAIILVHTLKHLVQVKCVINIT